MKEVRLDRDSVHAADDFESHSELLRVPSYANMRTLLQRVSDTGYLASIYGGKATWVAVADGKPVAIVAQQWRKPEFIEPGSHKLPSEVHFRYRAQTDPWRVLREFNPARASFVRQLLKLLTG